MRNLCAALLAVALVSSGAFAASENTGAIAPGKPAGVEQAQGNSGNGTLMILGGGAILVTLGLALSSGGSSGSSGNNQSSIFTTNTQ